MLSPGCFHEKTSALTCPHYGYDETLKRSPLALPHHTRLNTGRYQVGQVLGKPGGFGITYLGWDERLQTRVAIKEYLPRELVGRDADHLTVAAHSGEDADAFAFGLGKFLEEARTLARLDHPNLVRVRDFFEENGTGYLVMDYYDGLTLAEYLARQPGGKIPEAQAIGILLPILDGLREVHAKGFLHRDIKPANIYLTAGNRPILLDFGAARQAMGAHGRSLSVVLSEGYAPIEQYQRHGQQGPWSDVYGAAATLYTMVTGQAPPAATDRLGKETLTGLGHLSPRLALLLHQGMTHDPAKRPQSVEQWQRDLLAEPTEPSTPPYGSRYHPVNWAVTALWRLNFKPLAIRTLIGAILLASMGILAYLGGGKTQTADERDCDGCPEMVRLPGGSFQMGSPPDEVSRGSDESQHRVTVETFAIGKYEVTQAEWRGVMGGNPSEFAGCDRCPVENVSWHGVQEFLERLNARSGRMAEQASGRDLLMAKKFLDQTPDAKRLPSSHNGAEDAGWTNTAEVLQPDHFGLIPLEPTPRPRPEPPASKPAKPWRKWPEVQADPRFQALSSEDQEAARQEYFDVVVAPQVSADELDTARQVFNKHTQPGVFRRTAHDAWLAIKKLAGTIGIHGKASDTSRTSRRYRLPTEEEWEYACQAGGAHRYCGSDSLDSVAWYNDNSGERTHPVGQKRPNAWGLYDMSGNVWEWSASCYEVDCSRRVSRGGSWDDTPGLVRSAFRFRYDPSFRFYGLGFRLAQD